MCEINFDTDKTLEILENDRWGEPNFSSRLVRTCHALRKKPLKNFTTEDLRIMIGQNIGLAYLLPLAIRILCENILVAASFYKGDLLASVLRSDKTYWLNNKKNKKIVCDIFERNQVLISETELVFTVKKELSELYKEFSK